jgi:hypothetical protein
MRGGKKKPTGIIDVALWQSLNRGDVVRVINEFDGAFFTIDDGSSAW